MTNDILTDALPKTSKPTSTHEWGGLILESRTEYGSAARGNRGRYAGSKTHRLHTEYVVGLLPGATIAPGTVGARFQRTGKPVLFSAWPACGCTQGQMAGRPFDHLTAESVNCAKCLARD